MKFDREKRGALVAAAGMIVSGLSRSEAASAAAEAPLTPADAQNLRELLRLLAGTSRRRDFKTVPMILDHPDQWDAAPLVAVLDYQGGPRQAWDNSDVTGPWLKGMRNSINAQIWSFKQPNFLCVSATHGSAHLALFDQEMWDKYHLAKFAGGNMSRNTFIVTSELPHEAADGQSANSTLSQHENSVVALQQRGAVFMACHNAIWELAERLVSAGQNPDHFTTDALAAELTNHLIPAVILTPGIVATLVKLQQSGFAYSK